MISEKSSNEKMQNPDFSALSNIYRDDLPNKDVLDLVIELWKRLWPSMPANQRPAALSTSVKLCNEIRFPNLFKLL